MGKREREREIEREKIICVVRGESLRQLPSITEKLIFVPVT